MIISKRLTSLFFLIVLVLIFIFLIPEELESIYYYNYIINLFCIIISITLLLILYVKNQLDILEPLAFIAVIYISMYFFTPLYDICVGKLTWYGYDLFKYGIKATLIELFGFLVFFIFYRGFKIGKFYKFQYKKQLKITENNKLKASVMLILIMYIFCFIANAFYLMKYNGNGLVYILTLGILGTGGTIQETTVSIGFISMFSYSLPTITLLYWEFGKNKLLKKILFILMLMLQIARGFRFFVLQIAITFFAYYFIKNKKRPKFSSVLGVFFIVMIPVLLMTLFRNSIRAGRGIDIDGLTILIIQDAIEAAILDNFRIYQNFYGMVNVIPSQYPYVFGRQIILGTVFMVIPRIIWAKKLSSYGGYGLSTLIGDGIGSGQAYPSIGEYYYAGGIIGVAICMAIYGAWMKRIKNRLMYSKNVLDTIEYSVLLGVNLQLIIRGYMPSNFWYVIFAILPIFIIRHFGCKKGENT